MSCPSARPLIIQSWPGASFQLLLGGPKIIFISQCHLTIEKLGESALYM